MIACTQCFHTIDDDDNDEQIAQRKKHNRLFRERQEKSPWRNSGESTSSGSTKWSEFNAAGSDVMNAEPAAEQNDGGATDTSETPTSESDNNSTVASTTNHTDHAPPTSDAHPGGTDNPWLLQTAIYIAKVDLTEHVDTIGEPHAKLSMG